MRRIGNVATNSGRVESAPEGALLSFLEGWLKLIEYGVCGQFLAAGQAD